MNKSQKSVSWAAVALFALTFLAVPWSVKRLTFGSPMVPPSVQDETREYATFWEPPNIPNAQVSIDAKSLLLEWVGLGVVYFATFSLLKTKA